MGLTRSRGHPSGQEEIDIRPSPERGVFRQTIMHHPQISRCKAKKGLRRCPPILRGGEVKSKTTGGQSFRDRPPSGRNQRSCGSQTTNGDCVDFTDLNKACPKRRFLCHGLTRGFNKGLTHEFRRYSYHQIQMNPPRHPENSLHHPCSHFRHLRCLSRGMPENSSPTWTRSLQPLAKCGSLC